MTWEGPQLWIGVALTVCLAAAAALAVEEWFWLRRAGLLTPHARREMKLSCGCIVPNTITALALTGVWIFLYSSVQRWAVWHVPTTSLSALAALVAVDFAYYWEHRLAHRVQWLWRLYHATHHGSDQYTVATAYRVSFINHFFAPVLYVPCVLLGFEPLLVAGLQLLVIHYQGWVHTEMIGPLRWLDPLFNTPANHRVHHSRKTEHQGRNFGAILMLWDRVFGTYVRPERIASYGIPGADPPRTLLALYLDPLRGRSSRG
jgi:sterol desaturase/sphingolipid hydroxylase (fatty acid hydroxylase superfamily)